MNKTMRQSVNWIVVCVLIIAVAAGMARLIETDYGKVDVNNVYISDPNGVIIVFRLYRPVTASVENKLPAVINIHGYQNDKLSDDSYSIELSRRGFVVLAPDAIGHGDSGGGLSVAGLLGDPKYSASMQSVYDYARNLPYVNPAKIGVMGHSMGAIITMGLGANNPDINALNMQCGFAGAPTLKNVLLTQSRYDEFNIFREMQFTVEIGRAHV